jgi:hypothetical protein
MKAIKFKALYRGEWYEVEEMSLYDGNAYISKFKGQSFSPDQEHIKSVVQYTGIIDKNKVEVYEGHVIKYQHSKDSKEYIGEVFWKDDCACFFIRTSPDSGFALLGNQKIVEIVGDIYK